MRSPSNGNSNLTLATWIAAGLFLVSCGGSKDSGSAAPSRGAADRRDRSAGAAELRRVLDAGDAERAAELLETLGSRLGVEEPCLRARLAFLHDDQEGWMRAIESARAAAPDDPRPYATAAELWAAAGRLDAAQAELERGVRALGELTPELERAKGVLAIVTPGGTRIGLECLQRAVARDPGLPFVARPLGQAYLLAAKGALADQDPAAAVDALRKSLAHDPDEPEARELLAQALFAGQRYREAIELYEGLLADGRNVKVELALWHKNFALLRQIDGDRAQATAHYLRARELGLTPDELGSGAHFLRNEAQRLLEEAAGFTAAGDARAAAEREAEAARVEPDPERLAAVRAKAVDEALAQCNHDLPEALDGNSAAAGRALAAVDRALALDPEDRLARVLRAKLLFAEAEFLRAAEDFRWLVDDSRATRKELPEPVHVYLARCNVAEGATDVARDVLREYLLVEPEGRWLEETRTYLRELGG
jgi:tetratricopeptide (TPR) repeat protein